MTPRCACTNVPTCCLNGPEIGVRGTQSATVVGFQTADLLAATRTAFPSIVLPIHVHHLRPLAAQGTEYELDPIEDLRPACPNCHAMLHARPDALSIEELRALLRS